MKLITKETDYAVRSLVFLSSIDQEDFIPVGVFVEEVGAPRPLLRKILRILAGNGLLSSKKGRNGGFSLAKDPHDIYLTDLIEIFSGSMTFEKCIFVRKVCPNRGTCLLRKELEDIEEYVRSKLCNITIGYLTGGNGNT